MHHVEVAGYVAELGNRGIEQAIRRRADEKHCQDLEG